MAKAIRKEGTQLISIIADEDTVTGFLLTGIGDRNVKGETNFLSVDESILYLKRNGSQTDRSHLSEVFESQ